MQVKTAMKGLFVLAVTTAFIFGLLVKFLQEKLNISNERQYRPHPKADDLKYILLYTKYCGEKNLWRFQEGRQSFIDYKCPESRCFLTNNASTLPSLKDFDALLFHLKDIRIDDLPSSDNRRPSQRYVMANVESPVNAGAKIVRLLEALPDRVYRNVHKVW